MIASLRSFLRLGCVLAAATVLLSIAGCSSEPGPEKPPAPKASNWKPPPPLTGQETFFDGKITAELSVGSGMHAPGEKPADGAPPGESGGAPGGGRHMHGGGGGGGGGYGGRHGGGTGGEGPPPGPGSDPEAAQAALTRRAAASASGHPPVMIHLRLTNLGTDRIDVYVPDFLSPLGNFVVEPAKLTLEPGQSQEVEPMTSRLAGNIEETTVTLTLHIPGHTEKKVVTLRATAPAEASTTAVSGPRPESRPTQK
jgi:hypothetical protein